MNPREILIKKLVDAKVKEDNTIDLEAYAQGLEDMYSTFAQGLEDMYSTFYEMATNNNELD